MKTEPLFNLKQNKMSNSKKVTIGLIITGILSLILVLITIYGQFTGTFLIKLTYSAERKGILLSEDVGFTDGKERLILNPVSNVEDMIEENIVKIDEILASEGGQFVDEDNQNYVAYTFYIKNSGQEVVDVRYDLMVTKAHKNLDKALKIIMYQDDLNGEELSKDYYQKQGDSSHLGSKRFANFKPDEMKKITIIAFIDGHLSDPSMLGGAVRINLVFTIETAD